MFNINGEKWHVAFVPANSPHLRRRGGDYALGACNGNSRMIYIREDLNCAYKHKILCHEMTHAALYSYNVQLDDYTEELLADLFATYGEEIIRLSNGQNIC